MNKKLFIAILFAVLGATVSAQTTQEQFKSRYERQSKAVGADGVGVETIIDKWEESFPDDPEMFAARFYYNFSKSQRTELVPMACQKYLGQAPSVTLKDADGNDVNYFEDIIFDDDLFAAAMTAIDNAVKISPNELRYRYMRITALSAYEKASPDMAYRQLVELIDLETSAHPAWTLDGKPLEETTFQDGIAEYCYHFFKIGSDNGYEYFFQIAKKMNKLYPKNTVFINDIGSYYQVVKKNYKQAEKYYAKTLKISPDDYAARTNMRIIESLKSRSARPSK